MSADRPAARPHTRSPRAREREERRSEAIAAWLAWGAGSKKGAASTPFDSDGSGKLCPLKDVSIQRDGVVKRLQAERTLLGLLLAGVGARFERGDGDVEHLERPCGLIHGL